MAGIIRGANFQNIYLQDEPVMKTIFGGQQPTAPAVQLTPAPQALTPSPFQSQTLTQPQFKTQQSVPKEELISEEDDGFTEFEPEEVEIIESEEPEEPEEPEAPEVVSAEEAMLEREQLTAEYEAIRAHYEEQSEQYILRARKKADEVYQKTKEMAEKTILEARSEAEKIKAAAAEEGRKLGFEEGVKQGYDEGYTKALKKCKDSLLELKALSEEVTAGKNEIFMHYERQLFDTIFTIAQKITVNSLNQHDKGVITKMLREAGKKYKMSKNVTIMLSKLDVEEYAEIDDELLHDIFKNTENIEIEVLPDAPRGTLIIDNGSEITDAGVATQLQIMEQLGSGKYREKSFIDLLRDGTAGKKKKSGEKPDDDDDDVIPDVAYTNGTETKNG